MGDFTHFYESFLTTFFPVQSVANMIQHINTSMHINSIYIIDYTLKSPRHFIRNIFAIFQTSNFSSHQMLSISIHSPVLIAHYESDMLERDRSQFSESVSC